MYRDKEKIVLEEDEEAYGNNLEIVDKKSSSKKVPYSDIFR